MSDKDIYQILESLDAAQRSVKQLPALFKPKDTSPQLSGSYPGKNATLGYLVGEGDDAPGFNRGGYNKLRNREDYLDKRDLLYRLLSQAGTDAETRAAVKDRLDALNQAAKQQGIIREGEDRNPMAQAVTRRIVNQHPEWITRYGVEALMQAIDDVTEDETEWEEIGSSDVSAYVNYVKDRLDDRMGSREEMDDRRPFAEETDTGEYDARKTTPSSDEDKEAVFARHRERVKNIDQDQDVSESLRDGEYHVATVTLDNGDVKKFKVTFDEGYTDAIKKFYARQGRTVKNIDMDWSVRSDVYEGKEAATEDVISAVKKKLGDYLSDLSREIKTDPDLKDKIEQQVDKIGPAVKTITTDDGREIKIHGNEDDGFRITIKNKEIKTPFKSLDEAVMASEMYCARRRQQSESADYIEEA